MDFSQAEQERQHMAGQLARREISQDAYIAALNAIRVTDSSGRWWQPDPAGPGWLFWDGKTWIPGTPPAAGTRPSAQELMSMDEFKKISKEVPLAQRPQKWWDLLSILGGVVAAAVWFLYGGLREGFDILSAVLMVAMPVILVIMRPTFDEVLLPVQPTRKQFPRLMLVVIGILSPFLTAWILYNIFHISQYPLMQANIVVGTLVSYAIVRDPAPKAGGPARPPSVPAAGICIMICLLVFSSFIAPVVADDCTRDPLNAQDCLRTPGFAEIMAGIAAAILAGLVNGPTILQTLLQNAASGASPAAQAVINQTILTADLQNLITKLAAEGKYVSNATLSQKAWYNFPVKAQLSDWLTSSERLHCEEAAKYGEQLLKNLQSQFGKNVKMGQIFIERNPLMNHTANVVQFPNGEKYVVDVWRSLIDGKPAIYKHADWIKVWNAELGGTPSVNELMF
ncbi:MULTISPECIES: hypothetical protein [unclassified Methanoregula]|uniref:hypothetical protein n=1 Tax=unclassified Methanoregula TaxID=2649730 RepID=UPI0009D5DEC2|nr:MULTISPECIES: hypothetical protein [unclassified Methanoregula]OPX63047.1 MAG: hypothetical protein A4E33_01917 [Methanoregula sp. PtaB.Bin085]OPY32322.1 MAG: hypothetical protein A4E34_02697 [Methanoregula sp. PtaU1.Bin006]